MEYNKAILIPPGETGRINLLEDASVQDWATKFGISLEKLKRAVIEVGTNVKAIEQFLTKASIN